MSCALRVNTATRSTSITSGEWQQNGAGVSSPLRFLLHGRAGLCLLLAPALFPASQNPCDHFNDSFFPVRCCAQPSFHNDIIQLRGLGYQFGVNDVFSVYFQSKRLQIFRGNNHIHEQRIVYAEIIGIRIHFPK